MENANVEVADEVYDIYTNLLVQTDEICQFCYKTYVVSMRFIFWMLYILQCLI